MEGQMRRMCRLAVATAAAGFIASCGSTNNDALVLSFMGFEEDSLVQCDQVNPDVVDIDLVQDVCMSSMGGQETAEPFTETSAVANLQNNEKLDITLTSYTVNFVGTGAPQTTNATSQTITGRRCSNVSTQACAVDTDCIILGSGTGVCQPSISSLTVLLASFTTKNFLLPDIGKTVPVTVTFFGSDVVGNQWTAQGSIQATLEDFNNCMCTLA
jgi:hypothetical protein